MNSVVPTASGKYKSLMVLLHGLGSNGDDLFSLVPYFKTSMPDTYFFAPDAIEPYDQAPFGYQWFSLKDRSEEVKIQELERVFPTINSLIDAKKTELELEDADIILCGFSQGAMVSLYLALSQDKQYKAVIAFSGALIKPAKVCKTKTPICLIHGMEDDVVPYSNMKQASEILQELGFEMETFAVPNLGHSIDMTGLKKASTFIQNRL
ncbi:MAG: prolyl oligopeptidase family serine peptidase [Pseudomonadota bacterium]